MENINIDEGFSVFPIETPTNKIYARANEHGVVTALFSSVFEQPLETDILIEEGYEDYHAHVHIKYSLHDALLMVYNYKIVDGKLVERAQEEKQKEYDDMIAAQPPLPPTNAELDTRVNGVEEMSLTALEGSAEVYEVSIKQEAAILDSMVAVADVFEQNILLETRVAELEAAIAKLIGDKEV